MKPAEPGEGRRMEWWMVHDHEFIPAGLRDRPLKVCKLCGVVIETEEAR